MSASGAVPFTGLRGRLLAALLQWPVVRHHRVQLGFVEAPSEYDAFLADVIGRRLAAAPGRVAVFGAGAHSERLLAAVPDLSARVTCLTDNNRALWGTTRYGLPVVAPSEAVMRADVIVLSTAVFQRQLRADLARLDFRGTVLAMDDEVPPAWFLRAGSAA